MLKASLTFPMNVSSITPVGYQLHPQGYNPQHLWALQPEDSPLLVPGTVAPPALVGL